MRWILQCHYRQSGRVKISGRAPPGRPARDGIRGLCSNRGGCAKVATLGSTRNLDPDDAVSLAAGTEAAIVRMRAVAPLHWPKDMMGHGYGECPHRTRLSV